MYQVTSINNGDVSQLSLPVTMKYRLSALFDTFHISYFHRYLQTFGFEFIKKEKYLSNAIINITSFSGIIAILHFRCFFVILCRGGHTEDDFSDIKYFHIISLSW